jgi:hypothetical protein
MPKSELSPEQEVLAAHMSAFTVAMQMLVVCLQDNGSLRPGQYPAALHGYMEMAKDKANPLTLAMLDDLRQALLN